MTPSLYNSHMDVLCALVRSMMLLPIDELLAEVRRADETAWLAVPPLEFHAVNGRLDEQRRVLEAAQVLVRTALSIMPAKGEAA